MSGTVLAPPPRRESLCIPMMSVADLTGFRAPSRIEPRGHRGKRTRPRAVTPSLASRTSLAPGGCLPSPTDPRRRSSDRSRRVSPCHGARCRGHGPEPRQHVESEQLTLQIEFWVLADGDCSNRLAVAGDRERLGGRILQSLLPEVRQIQHRRRRRVGEEGSIRKRYRSEMDPGQEQSVMSAANGHDRRSGAHVDIAAHTTLERLRLPSHVLLDRYGDSAATRSSPLRSSRL
jgi:hypothetical protein